MKLSQRDLSAYHEQGFHFLPWYFTQQEIDILKAELRSIFLKDTPNRIMEKDGVTVRSVYGTHAENKLLERLVRLPRLLEPALQIIGHNVYVHQFKVNCKAAFVGDVWEWHQDYIFWLKEDGILNPYLLNIVIFLDEINEFNGPLLLIPGSHREDIIDVVGREHISSDASANSAWISNLTADLKYSLDQSTVSRLVKKHGIVGPKGPAGSVLFFHPNLVHGSSPNMSPFDRSIIIITYNSVENIPVPLKMRRPVFLASRDYQALAVLDYDVLQGNL